MATKRPSSPRSSASRRAWPPAPKVQSTTVSPGRTASSSRTSRASTGRCGSGAGGGQAFGNNLGAPFDVRKLAAPCVAVPDLEPVTQAGDDDVLAQRGVRQQRPAERDAALAVELALLRRSVQVAL